METDYGKEKNDKENSNFLIIISLLVLFLFNALKFINTEGSEHPLVSYLFNMIIISFILIYIYHKKDLKKKKDEFLIQTNLDKYLNKKQKK